MSREIKFRAWDKTNKRMVYDSTMFHIENGHVYQMVCWGDIKVNLLSDDFILEQFTGLKDKNGKEIYEGDNVQFEGEGGAVYEVVYDDDVAAFAVHNWDTTTHTFFYELGEEEEVVVIGNIHENPELIGAIEC